MLRITFSLPAILKTGNVRFENRLNPLHLLLVFKCKCRKVPTLRLLGPGSELVEKPRCCAAFLWDEIQIYDGHLQGSYERFPCYWHYPVFKLWTIPFKLTCHRSAPFIDVARLRAVR